MLLVSLYLTQHVCSLQKSFILLFYCDASHFVWSQLIQTEVSQYVGLCPDSWLTSKLDFFWNISFAATACNFKNL